MVRSALLAPGMVLFTLALLTPTLRRADGWLDPLAWTLATGGLSLSLLGAAYRTLWERCAVFLALALMGQACALAMVNAPNYGVVQHYLPWRDLFSSPRGLFLLGPFVQTVIAAGAVWQARGAVGAWLRRLLTISQALILVCLTWFVAAYGSWDVLRYAGEVGLAVWILVVNAVNLVLVATAVPGETLEAVTSWVRRQFATTPQADGVLHQWDRFLPWVVALWVTAISATLAWLVFERIPHIEDSVAFLFQAKYYSIGRLYLSAPPDARAFDLTFAINDGVKWYGYAFPGWPAVLALGVLVGVPWLVNPILAGVTILLAHALLSRLYSRSFAHVAVLFLAISPWFLFMSASFMTHPITLVWSLIAFLAVDKAREARRSRWGLLAGASLGALFLTRPLEGMLIAVVVGLWSLGVWGRRLSLQAFAGVGLAALLVGGLSLPYNALLTGNPFYFPMERYFDEHWYPGVNRLGFGPDIGNVGWPHVDPLPGHGPLDVLINANLNAYMLNFELFGWGFGSLGFVFLLMAWRRWTRTDWFVLSIIAVIVGGYSFYWFSGGPDIGARYWYQAIVPLTAMTLRGIQELQRRWDEGGGKPLGALRIGAFVVAASLVSFLNFVPWRSLGKYHHYRGMRADMARLAHEYEFGRSLVFVQERDKNDYPSAAIFNPPALDLPGTVFARDAGPAGRASVAQYFPNRPIWIVTGSPVLGGPFTVVAGPLPPLSAGSQTKSFVERP